MVLLHGDYSCRYRTVVERQGHLHREKTRHRPLWRGKATCIVRRQCIEGFCGREARQLLALSAVLNNEVLVGSMSAFTACTV
jgi:hypothetical protein